MIKNNNRNSRDDKSKPGNRSTTGRKPAGASSSYKGKSKFDDKEGRDNKFGGNKDFKPRTPRDGDSRDFKPREGEKEISNQERIEMVISNQEALEMATIKASALEAPAPEISNLAAEITTTEISNHVLLKMAVQEKLQPEKANVVI